MTDQIVRLNAEDICQLRAGNSVVANGVTVKPPEVWGGTPQQWYENEHGRLTNNLNVGNRGPEEVQ